jgi:hypothetical protein
VGWVEGFLPSLKWRYKQINNFIYLYLHVEEGNTVPIPQHSKLFIYLYLHVEEGNPLPIPQHSKLFIYLYLHVEESFLLQHGDTNK